MSIPTNLNRLKKFSDFRKSLFQNKWLRKLNVDETKKFLKTLESSKFASVAYSNKTTKYPYIQPRGGFTTFADQKKLTNRLSSAGADFIPLTVDSITRHNDYERAKALLEISEEKNISALNGYPLVCHGHEMTRLMYKKIKKPISLRHGTPDARVLVEIALASGITEIEGGGLCYSIPYSRNYPIDRALLNWQYIDRLCAKLSSFEKVIHRESFGPLTATMVPPVIIIVIQILELLLAVEQGVTSFAVSFGQTGSIDQDIATANVLRKLSKFYLKKFNFEKISLKLVYHQWMGAFPSEKLNAEALMSVSAQIANTINADKIVTKTYQEAIGVPSLDANVDGIKLVKYVFDHFPQDLKINSEKSEIEESLLTSQTKTILSEIFNSKTSSLWESVYNAVKSGIIDVPFSPHIDNNNKLITVRDNYNAIRIYKPGNIPINNKDLILEKKMIYRKSNKSFSFLHEKMLNDINLMI